MKTAGIICEYNPFHSGHAYHIEKTKEALGGDAYIVCVMSGNFVQRGDFAVFNKHTRAKMAVLCGVDVVIELPTPYALQSARDFAKAGVYLLDSLGVCKYLSFGSESGSLELLQNAARTIATDKAEALIRDGLNTGLPYASAQQKAADALLSENAGIFKSPNNTLGIEYIKAIDALGSSMQPMTVQRHGGKHDGDTGLSASYLRKALSLGTLPVDVMPGAAEAVCRDEMAQGRGPVFIDNAEQAILSRIRAVRDFSDIPGAADGLDRRFLRYANSAPTVASLLEKVKTKRFAMSRIRRVLMCAVLGITTDDIKSPPPYIRILAMNKRGKEIMKAARKHAGLPIITKPASVVKLPDKRAIELFNKECSATDFYALSYANVKERTGGSEWRQSPVVIG